MTTKRPVARRLIPWVVFVSLIAGLVGFDRLVRKKVAVAAGLEAAEAARQSQVRKDFDDAIYSSTQDRSIKNVRRILSGFGNVREGVAPDEDVTYRFHVTNFNNGDEFDVNLYRHSLGYNYTNPRSVAAKSNLAAAYQMFCRIAAWLVPSLLMLGVSGFYTPRRLIPWQIGSAGLCCVSTVIGLDPLAPPRLTLWAVAPFLTLTVLILTYLVPPRRRPLRRCQKCGYDLTRNVSGVCPECGRARPLANLEALAEQFDAIR